MTELRARMRVYDQAPAPDYWSDVELRASTAPQAGRPGRSARPALLLVAALLVILSISAAAAIGSGVVEVPWLDESPSPSPSAEPTGGLPEPSASTLPALGMPGMNPGEPAGEYGWQGNYGSVGWMHRVFDDGPADDNEYRQTQLRFVVQNDCFGGRGDPIPVTVAGFDGLYVEPYEDAPGTPGSLGATTGAYSLPIGDRTLCVYLGWDADITPDELDAARQVVESIRGVPLGEDGIRINFTLPFGWDTG